MTLLIWLVVICYDLEVLLVMSCCVLGSQPCAAKVPDVCGVIGKHVWGEYIVFCSLSSYGFLGSLSTSQCEILLGGASVFSDVSSPLLG